MPAINEASIIHDAVQAVASLEPTEDVRVAELIVADGGSSDQTMSLVHDAADALASPSGRTFSVLTCESNPGRGCQMNAGARLASGELLLFLHADCRLPSDTCEALAQTLRAGAKAGSFRHRIEHPNWRYRLVEWGDSFRQRWLQSPYGDQAIFTLRSLFDAVGGYPETPLMEDVRLVRKLRRNTRLFVIPSPLTTDARRWQRRGILRQFWINQTILVGERLGVPLERLAKIYYGNAPTRDDRAPDGGRR